MRSGSKLRRLAKTMLYQLDLYGQLACVEWKAEKARLTGMLLSLLLGFTFFLCLLLALSGIVLMLSWNTPYRTWVIIALVGFYGLGTVLAWYCFRKLASHSHKAFSDTREEIAVDIALLRQKMDP